MAVVCHIELLKFAQSHKLLWKSDNPLPRYGLSARKFFLPTINSSAVLAKVTKFGKVTYRDRANNLGSTPSATEWDGALQNWKVA